jgi:hypothetical protein
MPPNLSFLPIADTIDVEIESNVSWKVSVNVSWLSSDIHAGIGDTTLRLSVHANPSPYSRSAEVTITGVGVSSQLILITQSGTDPSPTDPDPVDPVDPDPIDPIDPPSSTVDAISSSVTISLHITHLSISSPVSESITLYSLHGSLLLQAEKEKGSTGINIGHLPKGVLIVRGSSGWTRKIIR